MQEWDGKTTSSKVSLQACDRRTLHSVTKLSLWPGGLCGRRQDTHVRAHRCQPHLIISFPHLWLWHTSQPPHEGWGVPAARLDPGAWTTWRAQWWVTAFPWRWSHLQHCWVGSPGTSGHGKENSPWVWIHVAEANNQKLRQIKGSAARRMTEYKKRTLLKNKCWFLLGVLTYRPAHGQCDF